MTVIRSLLTVVLAVAVCQAEAASPQPRKGFFVGGGFCGLILDGNGTYGDHEFRINKHWSDRIRVEEAGGALAVGFDQDGIVGFNWASRQLQGIESEIGWRISRTFSVALSYRYFLTKNGNQTLAWSASAEGQFAGVRGTNDFKSRYRQRVFQLTASYYLGGSGLFLTSGMEYISLQVDLTSEWTAFNYDHLLTVEPFFGRGEDHDFGLVVGAGYERPLVGHCNLVSTVVYSFATYGGDNLLARFDIGGLSADFRLRYYLR